MDTDVAGSGDSVNAAVQFTGIGGPAMQGLQVLLGIVLTLTSVGQGGRPMRTLLKFGSIVAPLLKSEGETSCADCYTCTTCENIEFPVY